MISRGPALVQAEAPSSQTPWIVDFLWRADPWVIVIGGLFLFFLARTMVRSLFMALARYIALGIKTVWEAMSGRG